MARVVDAVVTHDKQTHENTVIGSQTLEVNLSQGGSVKECLNT